MKDLFENIESLPIGAQKIINKMNEDLYGDERADTMNAAIKNLEPFGLEFSYGIDMVPFNLHWITSIETDERSLKEKTTIHPETPVIFTIGKKKYRVKIDEKDQTLNIHRIDGDRIKMLAVASNAIELD